jgi:hypothetical protein
MAKKPYIPTKNGDKSPWAANYKTEIATDGPTCGLSAVEVTAQETAAQGVVDAVNAIEAAKAACQSAIEAATTNLNNNLTTIRKAVKSMKADGGYTEAIGQNLGIIGDEQTIDDATSKPQLIISKIPAGYQIDFNLHEHFHGVHIYRRRPADAAFSYKATDNSSPYIDTDPQVDGTQYYAFYILNDIEVGLQSAIETVKV